MIQSCKKALVAMGDSENKIKYILSKNEIKYKKNIQRSLIINKDIPKNTKIKSFDIFDLKRSSKKNTFSNFGKVKNRVLKNNLKNNTPLQKKHFNE